jgi:hypothetical protein
MNTTSKIVISGIFAVLVVAFLGSNIIIQVNAPGKNQLVAPGKIQEDESQKNLQIQDCIQLKDKMANDAQAAEQYKSKDCAGLLAGTS